MNAKAIRAALRHDPLSHPVLIFMQFALCVIGALFWVQARVLPEEFDVHMYGRFALQFPAEMWAVLMMAPSAMCAIGLRDPVKRWMIGVGAAIHVIHFSALAYSAISTGGEMVIGYFCSILFSPLYTWMAWEAFRDA